MMANTELYACLYVRELPMQALLRQRPELRDSPCLVMEGASPRETVCSLNTQGRLLGITRGMTRVEVETFPDVVVLNRSIRAEAAMKAILLETASGFSPRVEERSEDTAFLCAIDIAGTETLFGPPEVLAKTLLQRIRALSISARLTVSENFHTAACLAKGLPQSIRLHVVAPGHEASALSSLPVSTLDLSEDQTETFALWGIHTLGMLADLPEKELISRMGQDGKRLQQIARGELPHLFRPVAVPFTLEEQRELDFPLEDLESLLFGMALMLDQLVLRAKARILALASVTVELTLDGGVSHSVTVQPALPTNDKYLWLKLLHHKLDVCPPPASILAVALHAEPGIIGRVQFGLFSPQLPEPGRLDLTLARIAAIVGEGNVGRAVLEDTHALDGFRMEVFQVPSSDSDMAVPAMPRASLRLLRPCERARVTLRNTQPSVFFFREQQYIVERAYGPWWDSGDWWNSNLWGFEQWDLVARGPDGTLLCCCLMRDLIQNEWQMAALYD